MKAHEFNFRNRKLKQIVLITGFKTPAIIHFATNMGVVLNPESPDLFYQLTDDDERNIYYAIKQGASEFKEIAELVQKAEEEYVPVDWELEEKFFNCIISGYFKGEDLERIEKYYEEGERLRNEFYDNQRKLKGLPDPRQDSVLTKMKRIAVNRGQYDI
jgi:TRAP-type uncharacterized transport system substrate-binding protein